MVDLANIDAATCIRSDAKNYRMPRHSHDDHAMLLLPITSSISVSDEGDGVHRLVERDYFYYVGAALSDKTGRALNAGRSQRLGRKLTPFG